ncbi:Retrovirus-related Pol polyprotein from transposon RE2 [Sesamum angolense]|uniref:Retrovirus-related Pol polyprotein from transposon RE2 n=1 Tax=Sesamum angolense TaxID=2727404 RepID=A0AAE2C6W7_9LAMI|nr:Retrovirus-related Pol polyprotein from transposon RE2 [Sesamum angolense]
METTNPATTAATGSTSTSSQVQTETEFLQLHGADHPGMVLREITTLSQGNMSVVDYYTKLRKLMQFLMGLGEIFDHVRNQLLVMDPIPSVNRAYSMVQSVEKQRQVHMEMTNSEENIAMQELIACVEDKRGQPPVQGDTKEMLLQELVKLMRGTTPVQVEPQQQVNFAQFDDFADTIQRFTSHSNTCLTAQSSCNNLWHRRLGHPSVSVQKHISVVPLVSISVSTENCTICPLAKQHRLPFPNSEIKTTQPFEMLHMDLWGPYHLSSLSGCHYFLSIVDDYSRGIWTFLLKHKSQVPCTLDKFFKLVHTQFQATVKVVRTDNGTEFINNQCHTLFTSLGILHQTSCSYTPQQNGVVERKHKQLLEMARALLFQSSLPKKFWENLSLTATYLINRLPTPLLNWKSPFEILYKKPPSYAQLKVFGCLCFASNVTPHKQKFDQRAYKCVFPVPDIDSPDESLPSTSPSIHISPSSSDTSTSVPPPLPVSPAPRRSLRTTSKPIWLSDYVCSCTETSITCSPDTYSLAHISFVAQISSVQEPKTYLQASFDPHWIKAMDQELQALETNGTWELTSLPPKKKTIGSRWVFKLKYNPDGSIERYKARLVAKGYNQIEGVDYFDSFSPVAKSVTVRVFLAIAVSKSWPLFQLDVNNAFLHGHLDEEVYMDPPAGYVKAQPGQVCKLRRSLYGLKQASRQWNLELTSRLLDFGFIQSPHDNCLFLKDSGDNFVALLVYVDDILLTGASEDNLTAVKEYLDRLFTIKDLGTAKYFLGLELTRSSHGLHVTQHKYLQDILLDASMTDAKPASTPFPPGLKLTLDGGSLLPSPDRYRRLVGRLLYLGFTRPDISFPVQQLSQFLQSPRTTHWDAALHILRYLRGSSSLGLFFSSRSSLQLSAFSDAAWASCLDSRRSITGFCIFLGSSIISWKTKKQATVSRSSAEAEYRSMASTVSELLWISYLLRDFQLSIQQPIPFWCDNKAALHITANPVFHERTKHLDIDCHLVRDQFKAGFISPTHIAGPHQPADLFTKAVPLPTFTRLLSKLGLGFQAPS